MGINLGTGAISKLYLGNTEIQKAYLGGSLVYDAAPAAGLLLDDYPNAAAAYSLDKLRTAYAGAAIRVRESGGNTETDIGFSGNVLDTAALLAHCGGNDGFVTIWYDQSGNSYDCSQATTSWQPQIVSAGSVLLLNGKPVVSGLTYNSGLYHPNAPTQSIVSGHGWYQVGRITDPNSTNYWGLFAYSPTSTDNIWLNGQNDNPKTFILGKRDGNTTQHTRVMSNIYTAQHLIASDGVTNNIYAEINNVSETGTQNTGVLQVGGVFIGMQATTLPWSDWEMQEWIVYPFDQSANRAAIKTNINNRYGVY